MKKTIVWLIVLSLLIIGSIATAVVFTTEDAARSFRDSFKDYPEIIGQANITRISALLDDETVVFEWKVSIDNKRDGTTDELRGGFEVPKADKENSALIQTILEDEITREFNDLNKTFVPNPLVEYEGNPLWGQSFTITIK